MTQMIYTYSSNGQEFHFDRAEIAVPSLALSDHYPISFTRKIDISDKKKAHTESNIAI